MLGIFFQPCRTAPVKNISTRHRNNNQRLFSQIPLARSSDLLQERLNRTKTAQTSPNPPKSPVHQEVMETSRDGKKHMKTDIFHFPVAVNFSFPFRRVTSEEEKFNGRTSGNGSGHRDHRTSWARRDGYRQPGVCGRTEQEPASAGSWSAHRRTSGSRRQWTWR